MVEHYGVFLGGFLGIAALIAAGFLAMRMARVSRRRKMQRQTEEITEDPARRDFGACSRSLHDQGLLGVALGLESDDVVAAADARKGMVERIANDAHRAALARTDHADVAQAFARGLRLFAQLFHAVVVVGQPGHELLGSLSVSQLGGNQALHLDLIELQRETHLARKDDQLAREIRLMTDHLTDELFAVSHDVAASVKFPISRLVVDPERFESDEHDSRPSRRSLSDRQGDHLRTSVVACVGRSHGQQSEGLGGRPRVPSRPICTYAAPRRADASQAGRGGTSQLKMSRCVFHDPLG